MNITQDITNRFQQGMAAINQKDFEAAKGHFTAVLEKVPGNAEALSFLGFVEAAMGNAAGGLEKTAKARTANPSNPQNLVNHAYALSEAGKPDEAISELQAAHKMAPEEVVIANQLSRLLFEQERFEEVEVVVRELYRKMPKDPLVANRLVIALLKNGKGEEAFQVATALRESFGDNPFVWGMLGRAARATERIEVAIENFRKLADHDPNDLRSLKALSHCMMKMEMYHEAIPVLKMILKAEPDSSDSLYGVGYALHNTNRAEAGVPFINRALELDPDNYEALLMKGHNHVYMGEFDEARACYNRVLELDPDCAEAYQKLTKMDPPKEKTETFDFLEDIAANEEAKDRKRVMADFVLGEMYESIKDYDTAFAYYKRGNERAGEKYRADSPWIYNPDKTGQQFENLKRIYSRDLFEKLDFEGTDSTVPIFIVGMPRSGTTLLEQIISNHSRVFGAGELSHGNNITGLLARIMGSGSIGDMQKAFNDKGLEWGADYVRFLPEREKGQEHVTDKMPNNFQNLGLLQVILPRAKYILIRRNPLDICLSIYCKQFSKSFSYARGLKTLGHYYRLFDDLMEHWKKVLPQPLLEIQYEELVDKTETLAPDVLKFCGLEWEDQCLEYYKQKSSVTTMSTFQVRKPINKSSVEKWRRYEKHIGPLLEGLGDDIVSRLKLD